MIECMKWRSASVFKGVSMRSGGVNSRGWKLGNRSEGKTERQWHLEVATYAKEGWDGVLRVRMLLKDARIRLGH
jgi:hypothetical protein